MQHAFAARPALQLKNITADGLAASFIRFAASLIWLVASVLQQQQKMVVYVAMSCVWFVAVPTDHEASPVWFAVVLTDIVER